MKTRKIGGHVSAAGGIDKAVERAAAIGANCVQVFSGSPRVWQRPDLKQIDVKKVFAKQQELAVEPIITHALYLLNLASDKPDLLRKSTEALCFDLEFDALLKGKGVVVHLGSHQGRGWETVRDQVAQAVSDVLKKTPSESTFLMENAAGQNGKIGGNLEELRWLLDQVNSPRLGWCLDTCHAFAGGYSLSDDKTVPKGAFAEITRLKMWQSLGCLHVNDSRDPFDSGRDRHANISEGLIPLADLEYFLNLPELLDKPLILEVPGEEDQGPDKINIDRIKKLVGMA
jgi:deoxyribonuclease-4